MRDLSKIIIVLFLGMAQFAITQTTCFQADNNYVFEGGSSTKSIAYGDFNNDGVLDVVMGNTTGASANPSLQRLIYIEGNSGRSYALPINQTSGERVMDVEAGDINGDGDLDVVLINFISNKVSVVFGNGDGTFQTPVSYTSGFGPNSLEIADFNNDSHLDVAVIGNGNELNIFLNDPGNVGTLLPQPSIGLGGGTSPSGIVSADFDNDGNIDLATSNSALGNAFILKGDGSGNFTNVATITTGLGSADIAADDLNGNGSTDLVVVNEDANNLSVLLNNGSGTFSSAVNYSVGTKPTAVQIADLDADGNNDIVCINVFDNSMSILEGTGGGSFASQNVIQSFGTPEDLVIADFDGDGYLDIANASSIGAQMPVFYGFGDGSFDIGKAIPVGNSPRDVAIGDFDGDGNNDFVNVNFNDNTASIFLNNGAGDYSFSLNLTTGANPSSVTVGDFNGDGQDDIIVSNYTDGTASVYLNSGGVFSSPTTINVNANPLKIKKGDFNSDNNLDLFVLNEADQVSVLPGNGAGGFLTPITSSTNSTPRDIAVGDIDNDGDDDFAIAAFGANNVQTFKSDGISTFTAAQSVNTGSGPSGLIMADLNSNGTPELIVACESTNQLNVKINGGSGLFSPLPAFNKVYPTTEADPVSVTAGDFNGDGFIDVAVAHRISTGSTGNVVLYVGDNAGNLTKDNKYVTGLNPVAIVTGFLDNNTSLDLAVVNELSDYVSIMLSSSSSPVITASGSPTICGSGSVTLTSTAAGQYLWSNGATSQSITVSTAGAYSVTTTAPGGGCSATSNIINVTVQPSPTLTFTGNTNLCIGNSTSITVSGADNYQWSDGLGTAATQNLTPTANKTYQVVGTNANGCTDTLEIPITVNPLPDASFNSLASQYCEAAGVVNLVPTTSGGTFSGPGTSGTTFDPSIAGVGTHTIIYSITDGNGCVNTSSQSVQVTAGGVDATFTTLNAQYCEDDAPITLVPVNSGGTFSGDGVSGNVFDPDDANIGTNTITYSITSGGCSGTSSQTVTINEVPDPDFNGLNNEYCLNDAAATLVPDVSGGTFSGPGISGLNFDPSVAGVGTHSVVYNITVNGCTDSKTKTVTVTPLPDATFAG
ncbi:hypothetical protein CW751_12040, partial [Brumimicrobium salinarum]